MDIPILYEDNHLLVVEKPVNIPVQQDSSKDEDLLTILKNDLKIRYQKPGNVYLGLVHRLDRPVGGAMVFAKTSKAASRLSDTIRRGELDRHYIAVVHGSPRKKAETLEHYLVKDTKKNIVHAVSSKNKQAKKAVLDYKVLKSNKQLTLLSIRLHTGRSHQIRVQFSTSGTPLYGDQKYGKNKNKPGQQIALWANSLSFPHPTKKEMVTVVSSPPIEFPWNLWSKLEK